MIVYNVTVKIDHSVHDDWLEWMKETHIPDVMKTGYFLDSNLFRVMIEEEDGVTYSVQYHCSSLEDLQEYQEKESPSLQAEHMKRYHGKFVAFRTLLEKQ